jgi:DNA-binding NarL/FixJ family response regulator
MAPTSVSPAIRVMVVGSNPIVCAGLVSLLAGNEDLRIVAVGDSADSCRGIEANVAVVGLTGLGIDAATRTIGRVHSGSGARLVAVVDGGVDDVLGWIVGAQADACLNAGTIDTQALVDAVRAVMGGQTIISIELLSALRERERAMAPGLTLTARERDVLALLAEGQSNRSIARQLKLQVGTISVYVSMILAKLGVANRTEAAALALRQGLLTGGRHPLATNNGIATTRR